MPKYGGYNLTTEQVNNAKLIAATGFKLGASAHDVQVAIMAAMTESGLRNLNYGDRDSLGLFQQRPSAGWGTVAQVTNPTYAATKFFQSLFRVKNRNSMDPWAAAQAVQKSAFSDGSNYKQYATLANQLGSAVGAHVNTTSTGFNFAGEALPGVNASDLADSYGFAWAFLKHHSDVWGVFQDAVKHNYTPEHFQAQLRNTKWFQSVASSVRQYQLQASSDPATLAQRRQQLASQIAARADAMGAVIGQGQLKRVTENALMFNWNDQQVQQTLGDYVKARNGVYSGQAATDADSLKQLAYRNGVKLASTTVQNWVSQMGSGSQNLAFYTQYIRNLAKTVAPGYANQLNAGVDLADVANPYIQAKASILQQDPTSIDLFDPDIRKALSATDSKGNPASTSLWQFEQDMRNKPEFLKTDTARDAAFGAAHKVLSDFGFMGA